MRIGQLTFCYLPRIGGIECYGRDLCIGLDQHEHSIFVTTIRNDGAGKWIKYCNPGHEKTDHADVYRFDFEKCPDVLPCGYRSFRATVEQVTYMAKHDMDVLIVQTTDPTMMACIQHIGKPTVVVDHFNRWFMDSDSGVVPKSVKAAVCFKTTGSGNSQAAWVRNRERNLYMIPPFIDYDVFKDYESGDDSVCYIGRISCEKGLVELASRLGSRRLRVVGYVDHPSFLSAFTAELDRVGRRNQVEFVDPISDREQLARELCKSRYFILPSPKEAYPLSLMQALSCNRICLSLGGEGLEWAGEHVHVVENLDELEMLPHSTGRRWIMENYNKEELVARWEEVFSLAVHG
jgi:glycosyltransferase involved in cell wall biosynthesis